MPQFLISSKDLTDGKFFLEGPEAFHLVKVLRHKVGDELRLFDGRGCSFTGVIESIQLDGAVTGRLLGGSRPALRPALDVRLYLGLLKASHWEWALEKGTELGLSGFVPLITPRTVVRLKEAGAAKRARWGKILLAAAKQSGRSHLPQILEPIRFSDAIRQACKSGFTLLGWERKAGVSPCPALRDILREASPAPAAIHLFVGPEGGFSDEEVELAQLEGARLFSLGPATLRAETAALAACAIILHEWS